jgi:6-pyruvoyltetrahydropterin/6-carboxytetrahydropterin synthase
MYTLSLRRDFIARHYLIGGDWGPENFPNSHRYVLELELEGSSLDQHGYLVDLVEVERHLRDVIDQFKEKMLNDLPDFSELNPSLEHFARILATTLSNRIRAANIERIRVRLWETESAWASFAVDRLAR